MSDMAWKLISRSLPLYTALFVLYPVAERHSSIPILRLYSVTRAITLTRPDPTRSDDEMIADSLAGWPDMWCVLSVDPLPAPGNRSQVSRWLSWGQISTWFVTVLPLSVSTRGIGGWSKKCTPLIRGWEKKRAQKDQKYTLSPFNVKQGTYPICGCAMEDLESNPGNASSLTYSFSWCSWTYRLHFHPFVA